MGILSLTRKSVKLACYRNYFTDSNYILHSDNDHQILFVGGPNTRKTNPRLRTAIVLKIKNRHISVTVLPIGTKLIR